MNDIAQLAAWDKLAEGAEEDKQNELDQMDQLEQLMSHFGMDMSKQKSKRDVMVELLKDQSLEFNELDIR